MLSHMGLRFRRRLSFGPGIRLNFSRSGVSTSVGRRGAWWTLGPRGSRVSVGLPGTGISYTEQLSSAPPPRRGSELALALIALGIVLLLAFVGR